MKISALMMNKFCRVDLASLDVVSIIVVNLQPLDLTFTMKRLLMPLIGAVAF
jgi:hypothetical protein